MDREANIGQHPEACTCSDCINARLDMPQKAPGKDSPAKKLARSWKHPLDLILKYKFSRFGWKFIINLLFVALLILFVWSCVKAFSHEWSPYVGFAVVVVILVSFLLSCILFNKFKLLSPSLKLTVMSLFVLFMIAAYSGIEPINTYKNRMFRTIGLGQTFLVNSYGIKTSVSAANMPWDKKELDISKTENILLAAQLISKAGDLKPNAQAVNGKDLYDNPTDYYGKVIKLSGMVSSVQSIPGDSFIARALGGKAISIVIMTRDNLFVQFLMPGDSTTLRALSSITIYGYPIGSYNGPMTYLSVVGKNWENNR